MNTIKKILLVLCLLPAFAFSEPLKTLSCKFQSENLKEKIKSKDLEFMAKIDFESKFQSIDFDKTVALKVGSLRSMLTLMSSSEDYSLEKSVLQIDLCIYGDKPEGKVAPSTCSSAHTNLAAALGDGISVILSAGQTSLAGREISELSLSYKCILVD